LCSRQGFNNINEPNLLEVINPDKYTILPNTAGCYNAKDAVRTCQLARELLGGHTLVKLEVLGDEKTLYPNIVETLSAAQTLIDDGFNVMVYTSDDPIVAKAFFIILPARKDARPAITACFIALAIKIGSLALAMAEFMSTPSQPNSIALAASLAQPMPASTSTGTLACCLMSLIFAGLVMP
jgi:hypothetical protein